MPLLHCKECQHEWEGNKDSKCAWCGGESYILEEHTALEKAIKRLKCPLCGNLYLPSPAHKYSQLACNKCMDKFDKKAKEW